MKVPTLEESNCSNIKESYIKKHYPEFYEFLNEKYSHIDNYKDRVCLFLHGLEDIPTCPVCGCNRSLRNIRYGYNTYCSYKCSNMSADKKQKSKATKKERYGDENYNNREKVKITCLERYGAEHYIQTEEFKEKAKATSLERYGAEHYIQTEEFKEKAKATCLERYGVEHYTQTDEYKEKYKATSLERYGDENYNNRGKAKITSLERYGVEHYFQSDSFKDLYKDPEFVKSIQEKYKATCLERYGVENYSQTEAYKELFKDPEFVEAIQEKYKATCLERYGAEHYFQSDSFKDLYKDPEFVEAIQEKYKATCLERYGTEYYFQSEAFKELYKDPDFVRAVQEKSYNTKKKNSTFNSSKIEELFKDYLIVNNIEFKRQYKSDLYPFSCDFYIPSKDLYIEIQASWTHGDHPFNENDINDIKKLKLWQSKDNDFYKNAIYVWTVRDPLKREIAKKNGIQLLEVFSNDIKELISIFEQYLKE